VARRKQLTIDIHDVSKEASWKLISSLLKALTGARIVTISPRVLTDEEPTYKLHTQGGGDSGQQELPF